jgi:hypothetical protein
MGFDSSTLLPAYSFSAAYHRGADLLVPLWKALSWRPSVGMKQARALPTDTPLSET